MGWPPLLLLEQLSEPDTVVVSPPGVAVPTPAVAQKCLWTDAAKTLEVAMVVGSRELSGGAQHRRAQVQIAQGW